MLRIQRLFILFTSLFVLSGCAAAWFAAGGVATLGGYKYIEGRVSVEYPLKYTEAWNATNTALENLKISISSSMNDESSGAIEAVQRDGIKIVLSLVASNPKATTITIRVGTLGDKLAAEKIHNEITTVAGI